MEKKTSYLAFPEEDGSHVNIEAYRSAKSIPHQDIPLRIPQHRHDFHEFVVIGKGSCQHIYNHTESTLIPGDVFLIPAHKNHGYHFNSKELELMQCQFYPERLGSRCSLLLGSLAEDVRSDSAMGSLDFISELGRLREENLANGGTYAHIANINTQGIIHLNPSELNTLRSMLMQMMLEQQNQNYGFTFLKQSYLESMLVLVKRVQLKQFRHSRSAPSAQKLITYALNHLETQYAEEVDFVQIAHAKGISANYFRSLFKEHTGLSPHNYLNRLRILKSLQYLQLGAHSIADVAGLVGIYDANYFSRLFKKIIGYSPTYFKSIQ